MEKRAILAFFKAEIIIFLHYKNIKYEKSPANIEICLILWLRWIQTNKIINKMDNMG